MKKVLFLFPHFFLPGGAANSTVRFSRALQQAGYTTEIVCAGVTADCLRDNQDLKFTVLSIPPSSSLTYWAFLPFWQMKINRTLSRYQDYIFFPQVLPSNWWAWIFKLTHRKQIIVWNCNEPSAFIHSRTWIKAITNPMMRWGAIIFNPFLKWVDIFLEKQNDYVFCNSQYAASNYEASYLHRKSQGVIYPPSYIKDVTAVDKKDDYIFTVSRLSKFKNVDLLVRSFAIIAEQFPQYKLVIAGAGEELLNLQKLSQDLHLTDRIQFLAKVSDDQLAQLYRHARATVLCAKQEPFGLVPIESMMYGTPVIAYKHGGPLETIIDGKTGYLFERDDQLPSILEKIITLDSSVYHAMQQAAQLQAKKFDITIATAQLEDIFNSFS